MDTYSRAADLPPEWDALCGDNYAARREFLSVMERGNACQQRYHVFRSARGAVDSILISFTSPRQNILCLTPFTWRVRTTFVHVPVSVARPGLMLGADTRSDVESFLRSMPGFVVVMDTDPDLDLPSFAHGHACFGIVLPLRWRSFEEYVAGLRSHYRYRVRRALRKGAPLTFAILEENRAFDERLFRLYENVHDRSRIGVERLTIEAFRMRSARVLVAHLGERPVGFVQMIENGAELVFAFVGLDYDCNATYDIYYNLLLRMVAYGIDGGFERLELGQTAEDAKLRLGGRYRPLRMHMRHSNPLLNAVVRVSLPLIQYRPTRTRHTVFNDHGAGR